MKKMNIVGTSGSGKSTLAKRIAQILALHYVELDRLFWKSNWVQPSDEEFFAKLRAELSAYDEQGWVIDGNYTRTLGIKWREVDTVVWLDLPFWLNFYQSLRRSLVRVAANEELWPGTGNRESLKKLFLSRESILWWMMKTHSKNKENYKKLMADPKHSHIKFIRLRSRCEVEQFCSELMQMKKKTARDTMMTT